MLTPKPTLTLDETAEALSIKTSAFIRDRRALEAAGFPRALPGLRAAIWSRAQVLAWIAANGDAMEPEPNGPADNIVSFVAAAQKSLAARYNGAAK